MENDVTVINMQISEKERPSKAKMAEWAKDFESEKLNLRALRADLKSELEMNPTWLEMEDLRKRLKALQDTLDGEQVIQRLKDEISTANGRMQLLAELLGNGMQLNQMTLFDDYRGDGHFFLVNGAKFKKGREEKEND